nr:small membrane protein YoaI [Scandinavium goeteborgense]
MYDQQFVETLIIFLSFLTVSGLLVASVLYLERRH